MNSASLNEFLSILAQHVAAEMHKHGGKFAYSFGNVLYEDKSVDVRFAWFLGASSEDGGNIKFENPRGVEFDICSKTLARLSRRYGGEGVKRVIVNRLLSLYGELENETK